MSCLLSSCITHLEAKLDHGLRHIIASALAFTDDGFDRPASFDDILASLPFLILNKFHDMFTYDIDVDSILPNDADQTVCALLPLPFQHLP